MSKFNRLIKCGNKKCNKVATNKDIIKLQNIYFNEFSKKCKKSKKNKKRKCIKQQQNTPIFKEFKQKYNNRTKCMKQKCNKEYKSLFKKN